MTPGGSCHICGRYTGCSYDGGPTPVPGGWDSVLRQWVCSACRTGKTPEPIPTDVAEVPVAALKKQRSRAEFEEAMRSLGLGRRCRR